MTKTMIKKRPNKKIAIIDVGSNSVRMVIYAVTDGVLTLTEQTKATCRLAEGMTDNKPRLNPAGCVKTLKTLRQFHQLLLDRGVTQVAAIATAAIRTAIQTPAGRSFLAQAQKALGHKITVISGKREAQLMARGLIASLTRINGICADIGGGSLELASVIKNKLGQTATLNLGSLRLYSESKGNTLIAAYMARDAFHGLSFLRKSKGKTLYIIGGSWRAIGRIIKQTMGLPIKQVHGFTLPAHQARLHAMTIAAHKSAAFRAMPKKINQRAQILPQAAAVLIELIDAMQPAHIVFSGHGLREGVLMEQIQKR